MTQKLFLNKRRLVCNLAAFSAEIRGPSGRPQLSDCAKYPGRRSWQWLARRGPAGDPGRQSSCISHRSAQLGVFVRRAGSFMLRPGLATPPPSPGCLVQSELCGGPLAARVGFGVDGFGWLLGLRGVVRMLCAFAPRVVGCWRGSCVASGGGSVRPPTS